MSDVAADGVIEQSEAQPAPALSIADHAAQFGPQATAEPGESAPIGDETLAQAEVRAHHSQQQRRERESGQFRPGRTRHRAQSQQATPDDVAAISEYTRRIKDAEAASGGDIAQKPGESQRVFELRRRAELAERRREAAQPAPSRPPAPAVPQARTAAPSAPLSPSTFSDAEPDEADPKFGGDYGKYLRAAAAWEGRKAFHDQQAAADQHAHQSRMQAAQREAVDTLKGRFDTARGKYPDFDRVALQQDVPWDIGQSVVHAFIEGDDNGPDVLYYLQSHTQERDALMQMSDLKQVKTLSLLSQRFDAPSAQQAGTTGSAASATKYIPPPKPPNPIRTEAGGRASAPPPTDGSLSIAEHKKHFGPRRK